MPSPKRKVTDPFPDRGHEAIREWVKQALDEATANTAGVNDTYFLTDLLFTLFNGSLAAVADLTARLKVLEAAQPIPPV